jgi:ribosomal-protein-serine acetyltransferase
VLIQVQPDLELRSVGLGDAPDLDALIAADRERLARFMPWAAEQTRDSTREFIRAALEQEAGGNGFHAVLVHRGTIAGTAGFHRIDRANASTSIGYWLGSAHEGRGLMTAAVAALLDHAFGEWRLHRIELRIAPDNDRSRALAARLGFREEGLLREAERFGDEHRDLIMHSLLAREWERRGR